MTALLASLLLSAVPQPQDGKPARLESPHFSIWSSAGGVPSDDFEAMVEGLYAAWKLDLGHAVEPAAKLKVSLYYDLPEFEKTAGRNVTRVVKGDTAHVLCDEQYLQGIGATGLRLYLAAAYPKLAARKDVFPSIAAGLSAYYGSVQWKDGKLELGSLQATEGRANVAAFVGAAQSPDWWTFDRAFKAEGKDWENRQRTISAQSWGFYQYLLGTAKPSVAEFLAILNDGKSLSDALSAAAKKANAGTPAGLEKSVKDHFLKMKVEVQDPDGADWISAESAHYVLKVQKGTRNVKSNATDKQILADLKGKMELLYEKYSAAFKVKTPLPQKATVKLYKDQAAYAAGGGPKGSAAYYDSNTKELVGYEDSAENGMIFQTLAHEGCHQFFDLAFPGAYSAETVPTWFSEGLAECFACSELRGRDLYVFMLGGSAPFHLAALKEIPKGEATSLKALLDLDHGAFMEKPEMHYAQSWSFVHFLWNAPTPDQGKGKYHEVVIRLIEGFKTGKSRDDVYKNAFQLQGKPLNLDALEAEWIAYTDRLKPRR